jgi:hypothetical protein
MFVWISSKKSASGYTLQTVMSVLLMTKKNYIEKKPSNKDMGNVFV